MSSKEVGFLRNLAALVSRTKLARQLGFSHDGKRDYYTVFGYSRVLTYDALAAKYYRQGVAARIVDAPAQAIWDAPPQIVSSNEQWNAAWNDLIVRNNLWNVLLRLDKLSGLGRYAVLFIGTTDAAPIASPVNKLRSDSKSLRQVTYFQVFSQGTAQIHNLDQDAASPRFMLPETYSIHPYRREGSNESLIEHTAIPSQQSFKVHASRVLHIAENTLENELFGSPRLERAWNDLEDLIKVVGGTAETFWLTANRGMQVDVDKDMSLSEDDAAALTEELEEYANQLRRFIRTRGVKISNLGSDAPNAEPAFNIIISCLSGSTGIPRRILTGSEAGQLASEQDRANWAERVQARRTEFAEPVVLYPLIARLTQMGILPSLAEGESITISWPEAFILSPLENAQRNAQHARSASNFASMIEKLVKLKQGTAAAPAQLDADGKEIPGTAKEGVAGEDYTVLIDIPWIQSMLGKDAKTPQLNNPEDSPEI